MHTKLDITAARRQATRTFDPGSLRGKHLLVVEEALKTQVGHWYEYNRAVFEAHRALGVETIVAAHQDVGADIQAAINAEPVFGRTNWDGIYDHPSAMRRYIDIVRHNKRIYSVMRRYLRARGPFDCVFVPTVAIHHVMAWRHLATAELGNSIGRLVLFFRNSIGTYGTGGELSLGRFKRLVWRRVFGALGAEIERGRVVLATDSPRLARELRARRGAACARPSGGAGDGCLGRPHLHARGAVAPGRCANAAGAGTL